MEKPSKLAFSDEATFTLAQGGVIIPLVIVITGFVLVFFTTDATLADLDISMIAMGGILVIAVGLFGSVALGHRINEIIQINRMFAREIWECWQFSAADWEAEVEKICNLIYTKAEGKDAYLAVKNSSMVGAAFAIIMDIIVLFAVKDPMIRKTLWITSGGVFLLFVGVGLFEPLVEKYKADRYRRKALRFSEPRVWFAPDGVYHESLGHTSLKELHKVTDQTKSRNRIQFTLIITSADSDDIVKFPTPVPSGCKDRAGRLVLRYRQERLGQ